MDILLVTSIASVPIWPCYASKAFVNIIICLVWLWRDVYNTCAINALHPMVVQYVAVIRLYVILVHLNAIEYQLAHDYVKAQLWYEATIHVCLPLICLYSTHASTIIIGLHWLGQGHFQEYSIMLNTYMWCILLICISYYYPSTITVTIIVKAHCWSMTYLHKILYTLVSKWHELSGWPEHWSMLYPLVNTAIYYLNICMFTSKDYQSGTGI